MTTNSCCCCLCVHTNQVAIIERFGKFAGTANPGCSCMGICDSVRGTVLLALDVANVVVDTKTRDNAVVRVETRVHYKVVEEKTVEAFYKFTNPKAQIGSFAAAVVRGEVPKYTLDELFLMSDEIKKVVNEELTEKLLLYGFSLDAVLLTKIDPSDDVKKAISLTQVNAFKRTAAEHEAELNKILTIKEAEADFEEKRLSGVGLAEERKAIMRGLQSSIEGFVDTVPGMRARDVMNLLLLNQYFDAMKDIGGQPNNRLVLLPGGGTPRGGNAAADVTATASTLMADVMAAQIGAQQMK